MTVIKTTKKNKNWSRRRRNQSPPVLKFSPSAWAKLLFLRDYGDTEIGGFGIAANNLLRVEDLVMVKQECSSVFVGFDDVAVADFFDEQVDAGRKPEQFARIWVHTHPGDCPLPSLTDEETFERVFGRSDWAVMFIIARGGQTYTRLRFNVGPGGEIEIPVEIDFTQDFGASEFDAWEEEYLTCVTQRPVYQKSSKWDLKKKKSSSYGNREDEQFQELAYDPHWDEDEEEEDIMDHYDDGYPGPWEWEDEYLEQYGLDAGQAGFVEPAFVETMAEEEEEACKTDS